MPLDLNQSLNESQTSLSIYGIESTAKKDKSSIKRYETLDSVTKSK